MSIRILDMRQASGRLEVESLREILRGGALQAAGAAGDLDVSGIVSRIIDQVRSGGDIAAAELTSHLDRADIGPENLRVPKSIIEHAREQADAAYMDVIRAAAANIREYQQHIMLRPPEPLRRGGREMSVRYTPIDRVGVYVPGGRALYPSTVLMTVIPAQVAGVREIAIASPPTGGDIGTTALALAAELGIDEVYRLGGAPAIAAFAYGTETIPPVDKVVGPGNAFVAEAKRQVTGRVGIDSIAGPSEVFIIADQTAPAAWVAADLLAQAEHNPGSAVLVTTSERFARDVAVQVGRQLPELDRRDPTAEALEEYSAIIIVEDLDAACDLANDFAAEHLQIITAADDAVLAKIRNAGAIFVGPHTPVPVGDYFAGPSHVLPTGGTAKFYSPLSCNDFLKASSVIRYDAESLAADVDKIAEFAEREGFAGHARSVRIRGEG
jgi:histidinol dehydrogenase